MSEDLVLAARRQEIAWIHSEVACVNRPIARVQRCRQEAVGSDLGEHRQELFFQRFEDKEARHKSTIQSCCSVVPCNATSRSCEGACLNHDVGELVEQR